MSTSALRLPRWRPQKLDRNHWLGSTLLAVAAGLFTAAGWAFWRWEAVVSANGNGRGRSATPRVPDSL